MPRYTVVFLPPEDIAEKIEAYARKPEFDDYAKSKEGTKLYRLGTEPENGEKRKAHITVAQFECPEETFVEVINWIRGQELGNLTATLAGYNQFPVPAGTKGYEPVLNEDLTWIDRDVARGGGLQEFNERLVAFLHTLSDVAVQDQKTGRKTVNGVGVGYRPHFTLFKANLGDNATLPTMPRMDIPSSFGVKVAVGESKLTGEFVNVWGVFENGQYVPVQKNLDFSSFDTYGYMARSIANKTYQSMPALSAHYAKLPKFSDMITSAGAVLDNLQQTVRRRIAGPNG